MIASKLLAVTEIFPKPSAVPNVEANSNLVTMVMQAIFGIAGVVAVLIITIAAFQYVISQGDPGKTAKAKDAILNAVIGLVIAIMGYSIVTFVIGRLI
jgi:glycine cleavage system protein P-like pyridoxal-binding family